MTTACLRSILHYEIRPTSHHAFFPGLASEIWPANSHVFSILPSDSFSATHPVFPIVPSENFSSDRDVPYNTYFPVLLYTLLLLFPNILWGFFIKFVLHAFYPDQKYQCFFQFSLWDVAYNTSWFPRFGLWDLPSDRWVIEVLLPLPAGNCYWLCLAALWHDCSIKIGHAAAMTNYDYIWLLSKSYPGDMKIIYRGCSVDSLLHGSIIMKIYVTSNFARYLYSGKAAIVFRVHISVLLYPLHI